MCSGLDLTPVTFFTKWQAIHNPSMGLYYVRNVELRVVSLKTYLQIKLFVPIHFKRTLSTEFFRHYEDF